MPNREAHELTVKPARTGKTRDGDECVFQRITRPRLTEPVKKKGRNNAEQPTELNSKRDKPKAYPNYIAHIRAIHGKQASRFCHTQTQLMKAGSGIQRSPTSLNG